MATVPLPSTVPNMMPPYVAGESIEPFLRKDGYFHVYDNRLGGPGDYTRFSADEMKELDREVTAINNRMSAVMQGVFDRAGDARLRIVRLDRVLKKYDGKHDPKKMITKDTPGAKLEFSGHRYSNRAYLGTWVLFTGGFREGGMTGLDQHHPSGLGYSIYSRELLRMLNGMARRSGWPRRQSANRVTGSFQRGPGNMKPSLGFFMNCAGGAPDCRRRPVKPNAWARG